MAIPLPEWWPSSTFFAALGGAILGAVRSLPGSSALERTINSILGFLFAIYIGPAFVTWLGVKAQDIEAAIIFACGAVGLVTYTAIIEGIRQTALGTILTGWLTGWREKKE